MLSFSLFHDPPRFRKLTVIAQYLDALELLERDVAEIERRLALHRGDCVKRTASTLEYAQHATETVTHSLLTAGTTLLSF